MNEHIVRSDDGKAQGMRTKAVVMDSVISAALKIPLVLMLSFILIWIICENATSHVEVINEV